MTITQRLDSVGRATLIIGVFSLLAKISGLLRDAILAHQFGTSTLVDAYTAAFRIPDFIFNLLILGTVSVAFIPIFSEVLMKDREHAFRFASGVLNITFVAMAALALVAFLFIDPLIRLIAPGFDVETYELTKTFSRIFLITPVLFAVSSVVSSILNTYKRFTLMAVAPLLYNFGIIGGIVFFYPIFGPNGIAFGVVLGALLHLLVQIPSLFVLKFRYSLTIHLDRHFFDFWKLYWPRIFSMGTGQVTFLIATFFGSFLASGSLSAFYYANNLQAMFLSIFAISAALAVFPTLSDLYNKRDDHGFKDVLAKTAIQIMFFVVPISVLMLVERAQIVRLIYGAGQGTNFDFEATKLVSLTLGLFVISLFAQGLSPLFMRAFYARHNTATPVIIGLITIALNVAVTYFLVMRFGVPGMALAFSLTSIIQLLMLVAELHHKIGNIHDDYLIINALKVGISSVIAGLTTYVGLYLIAPWVDMNTYVGVLVQAVGAGIIGVTTYVGVGLMISLEEAKHLLTSIRTMVAKVTGAAHENQGSDF
ncbi:MAG: murein biosynthesis integral membrane protein MurJ [Candidatus Doudnabacteria bacterium]|nr:murein biosynthesis integral membrane protein MurJ [Candidatus Doudnabacteria bacterium]